MTHENLSRRMTNELQSSSNISVIMPYVIHPKYILSEQFCYCFHQIFVWPFTFIGGTWQDRCGKEWLTKTLQEGWQKGCHWAQILVLIYIMSFIKNIYFLNHFDNVSSNFYMTGHVHPRILYVGLSVGTVKWQKQKKTKNSSENISMRRLLL
jgi:hypothetical protein